MKQRLLFTLLALFVSIGLVKADITFKVPKNTGTVTVTLSLPSTAQLHAPVIAGTSPEVVVSNSNKTYTIKASENDGEYTISNNANVQDIQGGFGVTFSVSGNATVTSIKGSGMNTLTSLTAKNVGLTELSLDFIALKTVDVSGNKLSQFNVNKLTALESIDASNNQITNLGESFPSNVNNTLKTVKLSNNKIGGGDFSDLAVVETFEIENNELEALNLSSATKLKTLKVGGNELTGITLPAAATVTPNWGTQEIELADKNTAAANNGISISYMMQARNSQLLGAAFDRSKVTNITWRKLDGAGTYQTMSPQEAYALFSTDPDKFFFAKQSGNKYIYIDTKSTYECEFRYDNKVTIKLQNIVISPAELTLKDLPESLRYTNKTATRTGDNTVWQGDHLLFYLTDDYKDYSIETFKPNDALTPVNDEQLKKEGGEFVVAGYFQKGSSTTESGTVNPSMDVTLAKATCEVSFDNTNLEGGMYKVESTYENKTIGLTSGKTNVTKGSDLKITINEDTGYTVTVYVNGEDKTNSLTTEKDGSKVLVLSDVTEAQTISVRFDQKKEVSVTLNVQIPGQANTTEAVKTGVFVGNKVMIGGKEFKEDSMDDIPLPIGKAQLSFDLTRQAVYGKMASDGSWSSWLVDAVMVAEKGQTATSIEVVPEEKQGTSSSEAAIKYTYDIEIPSENVTITIKFRKQQVVSIVPEGGANAKEQHQTYDGTAKAYKFSTDPKGLEDKVQVLYTDAELTGTKPTTEKPTAAGTYNVTVSIPASGEGSYAPVLSTANQGWKLIIDEAKLNFDTAPTVELTDDGKYSIRKNTGKVTFGSELVTGNYSVVKKGATPDADTQLYSPELGNEDKSHLVTVKFVANNDKGDDPNYDPAYIETEVRNGDPLEDYTVDLFIGNMDEKFPGTVTIYNGDKKITPNTKVKEGTKLTFVISVPKDIDMSSVNLATIYSNEDLGIDDSNRKMDASQRTVTISNIELKDNTTYKVKFTVSHEIKDEYKVVLKEQKEEYDGDVVAFDESNITIEGVGTANFVQADVEKYMEITYKDADGASVVLPKDAGSYTVCITIPYLDAHTEGGDYKTYKEFYKEYEGILIIDPAKLDAADITWPTKSSLIAKNQKLEMSALSGGKSSVPGTFEWKDKTIVPESGKAYAVVFVPDDKNYETVECGSANNVYVNVSDKNLVTFVPQNCSVVVKDANGKEYKTGDEIAKGTVLTITATPFTDCVMTTLTVNGKSITSGSTYTVGDETVEITAIAKLNPQSVILTITAGTGVVPSKIGAQSLTFNSNLTFTVATLEADKDKVTVTADGTKITPNSSGVYSVKADKAKTVSVSVSNPTAITVKADTTLSPGKKPMGTVEIQGWTSTKKYYYGDEIIVTAFPESGATFTGWQGLTSKENPLEITLIEPSYTFKAQYSGTLVGIEDVETVKYYGADGYIYVNCPTKATLIVISMNGRSQRLQVSGQTRVTVAAGIYGIVLDMDGEVIRDKVVVR